MTAPALPCSCGVSASAGDCAGRVRVCLKPGLVFDGSWQLRTPTPGLPMSQWPPQDWPLGTLARMVWTWGTGTELIIPSEPITDSWLKFHMTEAETEQIPRRGRVEFQLNYGTGWRSWLEGECGCG